MTRAVNRVIAGAKIPEPLYGAITNQMHVERDKSLFAQGPGRHADTALADCQSRSRRRPPAVAAAGCLLPIQAMI